MSYEVTKEIVERGERFLRRWISQRVDHVARSDKPVRVTDLYEDYEGWCKRQTDMKDTDYIPRGVFWRYLKSCGIQSRMDGIYKVTRMVVLKE